MAECYIGFQKLLTDELKAFDLKDSIFFETLKNTNTPGGAQTTNALIKRGSILKPDLGSLSAPEASS
jgi:hypothetical protein